MMNELRHFDYALRLWVVTHRLSVFTPVLVILSAVGRGGMLWLVLGALLTLARRMRPSAFVQLALAILVAWLMTDHVLKPWIHRERPFAHSREISVIGSKPHDPSFPSGHSANAFAGAYVLGQALPAGRFAWLAVACAIAYSRVYLGVHYPLDVFGGALVGLLSGFAIYQWTAGRWFDGVRRKLDDRLGATARER